MFENRFFSKSMGAIRLFLESMSAIAPNTSDPTGALFGMMDDI